MAKANLRADGLACAIVSLRDGGITSFRAEYKLHYLATYSTFGIPLLLYWLSYVWLTTHRGRMHDDWPVFTIRDRVSRIVLLLGGLVWLLAI